jgi:hypothetical protein
VVTILDVGCSRLQEIDSAPRCFIRVVGLAAVPPSVFPLVTGGVNSQDGQAPRFMNAAESLNFPKELR